MSIGYPSTVLSLVNCVYSNQRGMSTDYISNKFINLHYWMGGGGTNFMYYIAIKSYKAGSTALSLACLQTIHFRNLRI
jgi:hypothetical protein